MTNPLSQISMRGGALERRSQPGQGPLIALWLAVCVAGAWGAEHYGAKAVLALVAAGALGLLARLRAYGVLLGLALIGTLNGFPGVNVNPGGNAISHTQDVFAVAILAGSAYVALSGKVGSRSPLQKSLYGVSAALVVWWVITWARTVIFGVVPASLAARFARDFLYFGLTLPLLCDVLVTYPRLRRQLFWTLGIAGAIFAGAQIVFSQAHVSLNFILHSELTTTFEGTTRVYSAMTMLVRAGFALSVGAVIVGPSARVRRWALLPAALFAISIVLQLTRAAYFGAAAGVVLAGLVWWFRRDASRMLARKQLLLVPLVLVLVIGATSAVSSGERHLISKVAARAVAGFSEVNNTSGTVGVRTQVANEMLRVLGGDWPVGLGFQHPAAHPYPSLPDGSIRDTDFGVLQAVMLMGALGAILVYLPVLVVLRSLLGRAHRPAAARDEWLRLGTAVWIIAVLASSLTLGELFTFGGLELSAVMLALAVSVVVPRYAGTTSART